MAANTGFDLRPDGYNVLSRDLTKAEESLLIRIFHNADAEKKGFLSRGDLKVAMVELLGYKPTKYEVSQMMNRFGENIVDKTKGIRMEKFVQCMTEKLVQRDEDEEIRHTFMAFDLQCHGFLTVEDLQKVFSQVMPHVSAHSVHSAFRELDQDGDGRVSYKDFEFLMKYNMLSDDR